METSGFQLSFALLLVSLGRTFATAPTYQWTDQETGEEVTCQKCPRGTFVVKHCTSRTDTECQPCPDNHYTSYWNYVEKCRFCNVICEDKEQVKHECNGTQNRVCECKPGYRREFDYCVRDCTKLTVVDDPDCDTEVMEFVTSQNLSMPSYQRLLNQVNQRENSDKRKIPHKKLIRSLLRLIKNANPHHALLPQLMELVKRSNLTHLERELKNRFIKQEDDGKIVPSLQQ